MATMVLQSMVKSLFEVILNGLKRLIEFVQERKYALEEATAKNEIRRSDCAEIKED
jgi:hypothetical protein